LSTSIDLIEHQKVLVLPGLVDQFKDVAYLLCRVWRLYVIEEETTMWERTHRILQICQVRFLRRAFTNH